MSFCLKDEEEEPRSSLSLILFKALLRGNVPD